MNLRRIFQCNYIRAVLIEFEKIQAVFVVYREMSCKDDFFEFNFPAFMGDSFIFTFFILNEFFNKLKVPIPLMFDHRISWHLIVYFFPNLISFHYFMLTSLKNPVNIPKPMGKLSLSCIEKSLR